MDPRQQTAVLNAVRDGATYAEAARAARCTSSQINRLKATDADFAQALLDAEEDSIDTLEAAARSRALGYDEPVIHQGAMTPVWERDEHGRIVQRPTADGKAMEPVQARNADGSLQWLTVRKHSDAMMALLLKGRRKRVFADRMEHTGADGGAVKGEQIVILTGVPRAGEDDLA